MEGQDACHQLDRTLLAKRSRNKEDSRHYTAAGLKLIWKMCTSQSLYAQWMKERYCKNLSIWEAPTSPLDSGTRKFLATSRVMAANNMTQDTTGKWIWNASSTGSFNFKSAWNLARTPTPAYVLHSLVWFPAQSPKMPCCLLRVLKNRLLTRDRLYNFGITQQTQCVLCNSGIESIKPFFFECPFAAYLWTLCKLMLKPSPNIKSL